jgi:hypothetical protein
MPQIIEIETDEEIKFNINLEKMFYLRTGIKVWPYRQAQTVLAAKNKNGIVLEIIYKTFKA